MGANSQRKDHNQLGIHLTVQALVCALKKEGGPSSRGLLWAL